MKLTLGFSPCPNDTFIFDAMIHQKVDTEGLTFEVLMDDVETLNNYAIAGKLDITKLSFHAFAYVLDQYVLLDAGSALGFGVGPMLISAVPANSEDLLSPSLKVGIPGKLTTANFLLGIAYPQLRDKKLMLFSEIENALLEHEIDLGLIIHENRFTYEAKGLFKVMDLGKYWETLTGCAIPLGGIVVNRGLAEDIKHKVNRVIKRSVEFAFANPTSGIAFIKEHAQEMEEAVMYKHIELYVNKYSVDLGADGRKAIDMLFNMARERNLIPNSNSTLYLT